MVSGKFVISRWSESGSLQSVAARSSVVSAAFHRSPQCEFRIIFQLYPKHSIPYEKK